MTDSFDPEPLHQLRDRLDVFQQQQEKVQSRRDQAYAVDEHEVVELWIAPDGALARFVLREDWRKQYHSDELATVVFTTYTEAVSALFTQWYPEEEPDEAAPRPRPAPPASESVAARIQEIADSVAPESISAAESMNALRDVLREMRDGLDTAVAAARDAAHQSFSASSDGRNVTATVDAGGALIGLEIVPAWAEKHHSANIARAFTKAVTEARRLASENRVDPLRGTALGATLATAMDPQALAARLRII